MKLDDRINTLIELGFREGAIEKLKQFIDHLWDSNEDLNLISRKMSMSELIDNHVIDCLLPLRFFPKDVKAVADFGSGGGLPGVIYALQFPDIQFHLYEKSPLKQKFLESCKTIAPNLSIHGEIKNDLPGIDLVTSRAFKPIDVILDMSRKYYSNGGHYFLLKGRQEKISEEIATAKKKFKNLNPKIEKLVSPVIEVERHLVLI